MNIMKPTRIVIAVVLVLLMIAALLYSQRRPRQLRVSGFVESHEIRIGSRVGGRVAEVLVDEGDRVQRGAALVRLEPFDLLQRRAEAEAMQRQSHEALAKLQAGFRPEEVDAAKSQVDQQRALLQKLITGPRKQEKAAGRARLKLAQAEEERAQLLYNRLATLVKTGAATPDQFEESEKQLKVAHAQVEVAQDELALLEEGTRPEEIDAARATLAGAMAEYDLRSHGYRAEDIAAATAAADAAQATLDAIDRQIAELTISAPVDGTIEATDLRPGDLITANGPAISMVEDHDLWVRAYVPENHLNLEIGQELKITVDSFPHQEYHGRITYVARQAEFTPGNVQTPEERSKQVFRIKVVLETGLDVLRPGMSADVWLEH
jgi:multidrug resistance efflux pump